MSARRAISEGLNTLLASTESACDQVFPMEGLTGIEPALSAWEAEVLPLNYSPVRRAAPGQHNKPAALRAAQ